MENSQNNSNIDSIVLEKIKISVQEAIPDCYFLHPSIESTYEAAISSLILKLSAYVYANKVGHEVSKDFEIDRSGDTLVPATWFDAFKRRWLPWLKINYSSIPTRYIYYTVHKWYKMCPHLRIETPEDQNLHLAWLKGAFGEEE